MKLEAKGITFSYRKELPPVLKDFSLTVESGQRMGILAPSGFGKSTVCKLLSGYLAPDQGEILLDGKPLSHYGSYCPVQLIYQHPEQAVDPRLRMRDILAEGDQVEARIIRELGIEDDWLNRFPTELSGGELQRFCIARALGQRTRFLLADEISAMLDLITQSQLWSFLLSELEKREIGLVAVSHDAPLMERICTDICKL